MAGGDRLQQLVGRPAEIDAFDLQPIFFEEAALKRHRPGRWADGGLAPRDLERARRRIGRQYARAQHAQRRGQSRDACRAQQGAA
ncbi:hypothetical protein G6F31_016954 [Rhizopus arrhizus]|nr:hypothetical protein G6F31_016954 [Rhizopus arrhizus]